MDAQLARSQSRCSSLCQSASVLEVDTIINIVLSTPVYFWLGFNSRNKSLDPPRAIHMSFLIKKHDTNKAANNPRKACSLSAHDSLPVGEAPSCLLSLGPAQQGLLQFSFSLIFFSLGHFQSSLFWTSSPTNIFST